MSAPTAQTLQRVANETGLQVGALETVLRLLDVLQNIAGDRRLADRFVLEGGTALNVFISRSTGSWSTSTSTLSARLTAPPWRPSGRCWTPR